MAFEIIENRSPFFDGNKIPSKSGEGKRSFINNGYAINNIDYGFAVLSDRGVHIPYIYKRFPLFEMISLLPIPTIYGEFTITPDYVDLGIISEDQTFTLTLCSKYNYKRLLNRATITGDMDPVTVSRFDEINDAGILFEPNECMDFIVSVDADSSATNISGYINFYLSNGQQATVRVIGTINKTGLVFNDKAKTISGVSCELIYNTKKLNSIDGTEYRVLIDKHPKETTNQQIIQKTNQLVDFINARDLSESVAMANYFYSLYLCESIAAGTQTIIGNFIGFSTNQNGTVFIKEGDISEGLTILNMSATHITFKNPVVNNYIKPVLVPVHTLTFDTVNTVEYQHQYQLNVSARRDYFFNMPPKSLLPETVQQVNGKYVFPLPYDFMTVSKQVESGVKIRDFKRGVWDTYAGHEKKTKSYQIRLGFETLADYQQLVDFYDLVKGDYDEFYIPSVHDEILYETEDSQTITDKITVLENPFIADFQGHSAVFFKVGCDIITVGIESYDYDNATGNTTLTFDEALNLNIDDVCFCGWSVICRFDGAISSTRQPFFIESQVNILEWY